MNYLSVESLSKSFREKPLFTNISFGLSEGEKVALVARNGAGKSTLMRILTGKEEPDSGSVTIKKDLRVAFLDQDPKFNPDSTVLEAVYSSSSPVLALVREYEETLEKYSADPSPENEEKFHEKTALMDAANAWDHEKRITQILYRLKITDLKAKMGTLSGGQKKRVALSAVLISDPDLLILDEPTNHLDLDMIEWLENYLSGRLITLLLVTHDRYFLDRVCDEILELDGGNLYRYKGNFTYFIEKKAEREAAENSSVDKARNLYRRELEWVRRMPKARGTKSKSRVDAFYETAEKAKQKKSEQNVEMSVKMSRLGGKILELEHIHKKFGDKKILEDFTYTFKRNEKIGIVGRNGTGKSTFLNILLGKEPYDK